MPGGEFFANYVTNAVDRGRLGAQQTLVVSVSVLSWRS